MLLQNIKNAVKDSLISKLKDDPSYRDGVKDGTITGVVSTLVVLTIASGIVSMFKN